MRFRKENEHVFPFELMEYFELVAVRELGNVANKEEFYEITFKEKDIQPYSKHTSRYESSGYLYKRIQDFPLMGKPVFIELHRRLWRHKENGQEFCKNLSSIVKHLKLAKETIAFLRKSLVA